MPRFWRKMFDGDQPRPSATGQGMTQPAGARFGLEVPPELLEAMGVTSGTIAPRISRDEALQVPAVMRVRNLIAGTLATLPLKKIGPDRRALPWPLFDQPDPDIATSVMFALTFEDLLFEGISWWRVTGFRDRWPAEAIHIDHRSVHVPPALTGRPSEQSISRDFPFPAGGRVFIDGMPVEDREVIQFLSPNPPLLVHAARAIRTCLKLDRAAALYSDDPLPLGYFEPREGTDGLSSEPGSAGDGTDRSEVDVMLDAWELARSRRAWGYVQGMTAKPLQWNPEQLQLADQRQHAVLEIARAAGVDPEDLGVSTTSRTYQNSEHRRQDLLDFTLGAYVSAFQDRLSMRDVTPLGEVARMKFDGFLRSTTPTRMDAYKTGLEVGAYTKDEIRELEDRPPVRAGSADADVSAATRALVEMVQKIYLGVDKVLTVDEARQILNRAGADLPIPAPDELTSNDAPAREAPAVSNGSSNGSSNIRSAAQLQPVKFADDGADVVRLQFDTPEVAETFRVNVEKRTISGLAVPWGKIARSGFSKWRFAEGSLRWSSEARVKLNLHHEFRELIGRGVRLQSTSSGLDASFKIARGEQGDRALSLAEDGVLDGFSIEVDFVDDAGDEWQADPSDESVRLVRQATLRGVALTGMPAFDDARVTAVAATRDGGKGAMPDDKKTTPDGGGGQGTVTLEAGEFTKFMDGLASKIGESHQNLTKQLSESLGESFAAGMKAALENIHDPQTDGPEPVRAARFAVTREAPIYTFDGRGASLVRDAWYAQKEHDQEAQERIRRFHTQSAEVQKLVSSHVAFQGGQRAQFATVTTGTASDIIPPGYRPDLFVPQLEQGRPFVNALSRGTIANATPFVVPVFGSLTGGTGDHTEASPPTEGTLAFTTKTVTPGAISGKLPLSREIVDSSNPAIDQIALAAMREDYARQTETKVYTLLNGVDGQGGVIAAGFVPSGAQVAVTASLAAGVDNGLNLLRGVRTALGVYPFRRFAAPNRALMSQEATTAFATAEDAQNRPLLPSVGAQNAAGFGNAVQVGWFVDGLAHVPAWAITGNTATDADVFTLNSMDAWVWESPVLAFRFEEKQGPEIIELALFGYFATHLLRPVGLSAIRHTVTG